MDRDGRRHLARIAALVLGALVLAAALAAGFAEWEWRASFGAGTYAQRLDAARRAAAIAPWLARYAARPDIVRADEYARRNQPANAYAALRRAIERDPGDPSLRARLERAYRAYYDATTYKAHLQHAHEQTGGYLPEEGVVR